MAHDVFFFFFFKYLCCFFKNHTIKDKSNTQGKKGDGLLAVYASEQTPWHHQILSIWDMSRHSSWSHDMPKLELNMQACMFETTTLWGFWIIVEGFCQRWHASKTGITEWTGRVEHTGWDSLLVEEQAQGSGTISRAAFLEF